MGATAGLIGKGSYAYWGREGATWGSGDPSTMEHMPFNPMTDMALVLPIYLQEQITLWSEMDHSIEFDTKIEVAKITIRTFFRDPLLLLTSLTHKTVTSPWTGSQDTITGTFSDTDDDDSLWMQVHIHNQDGTNHINLLFKGGDIIKYRFIVEAQKPVMEEVELQFRIASVNTQVANIDTGLDAGDFDQSGINGGFALWDGSYTKDNCALSKDCTITWGGSAITGLWLKKCTVEVDVGKMYDYYQGELEAQLRWHEQRSPFKAICEGVSKGNQDIAQLLAAYSAKTKQMFKVQYGTVKYIQFSEAYLKNIEGIGIPKAGETTKVTHTYQAGAGGHLYFSWTGSESTNPSSYITH